MVHKSSNSMAATPKLKHIFIGIQIFQAVTEVCHFLIPILIFNCISPRRRNEHPSLPSPLTSDDADVGSFFCFKYLQLFISPNSCSQILTAQHSHCNIMFGSGWHDHCLWEAVDNYAMKTEKKDDRLYLTSQFSKCDSSTTSVNSSALYFPHCKMISVHQQTQILWSVLIISLFHSFHTFCSSRYA